MITPSIDLTPDDVALVVEALGTQAYFTARYGEKAKIERCNHLAGELKAAAAFARGNGQSQIADSKEGGPRA